MATVKPQLIVNNRPGRLPDVPDVEDLHGRDRESPRAFPRLIVAIPAYNEEVAIGSIVLRCRKHADEVLVLDDGSSDRTAEIARAAGARVISHLHNEGKGAGIRTAFLYAKNRGADVLVLIDGDGQHDPDDIPALVLPIAEKQADLVIGSRFLGHAENDVPVYRRIGQEILTLATNAGTRRKITDSQSGFRAFARKSFECFSFSQNGMAIESEMLMDAAEADLGILEVPISVRYDVDGSTLDPLSHGISVLNKVLVLVSQRRPLLFFFLPGVILMFVGLIFAFMLLSIFDSTRGLALEYGIGSLLFVIMGMMLISTGLTLSSLKNIAVRR